MEKVNLPGRPQSAGDGVDGEEEAGEHGVGLGGIAGFE
jgi:hypothetical protein